MARNVTITDGIPVELYGATGITPGVRIIVTHNGGADVRLAPSQMELLDTHQDPNYIIIGLNGREATNQANDQEAWAMSEGDAGINVRSV